MNTLDSYTREKANQIHLDELHREAQVRRLLRGDGVERQPRHQAGSARRYLAAAIALLIAALAAYMAMAAIGIRWPA